MFINYINRIAFKIFNLNFYWYGIIILIGVYFAFIISIIEAKKVGIEKKYIINFGLYGGFFSIFGARLYYVLCNLDYYNIYKNEILYIRNGGLAFYGGLIFGIIFLYFYCRYYYISFLIFLDIISPGLLIAQIIGRWGNFVNHEAFGNLTSESFLKSLFIPNFIIKNMFINGNYYHPTFFYECIWNIIGFIIIIIIRKNKNIFNYGEIFFKYLLWYSFGRFFIEIIRYDSLYILNFFKISQVISVILFLISIIYFILIKKTDYFKFYYRFKKK